MSLFVIATLLVEYLADVVFVYCREQRFGYFDSRLNYYFYVIRLTATYLCVMLFLVY